VGAGAATGSAEYEEVLGCLASLIKQKVRADTGNRGNQWELMAKYLQVVLLRRWSIRFICGLFCCF
jgi:folylpolyglutamate synthase